jgi:hypothetical protein
MNKVVHLGRGEQGQVFCRIEFEKGRLSICGVEGPMASGNARGGCGQIVDVAIRSYAPGWDAAKVEEFRKVWDRWHLNDLRAGCEHQRATWDTLEKLEVVTYRLTAETTKAQNALKASCLRRLGLGETLSLSPEEQALLALPWETKRAPDADGFGSGRYEVHSREQKGAGWVYPAEHDRGLLCKPCEVCGYKYGSAWLREEVPVEVVRYLEGLPETDVTPAWV